MPVLPLRAAAYTRTGIVRRFFDQLSDTVPQRIDNTYAEGRLGLKGGDVRAFLQSMRVLGFIDPYGSVTDRGRRTRAVTHRAEAVREGLEEAYPDLAARWDRRGGMSRQEIEDFFKYEYGLSASSAGPAAKLFEDLMQEYGVRAGSSRGSAPWSGGRGPYAGNNRSRAEDEPRYSGYTPPAREPDWVADEAIGRAGRFTPDDDGPEPPTPNAQRPTPALGYASGPGTAEHQTPNTEGRAPNAQRPTPNTQNPDVRVAALDAIKNAVKIEVTSDWDERKIDLVFDRMERLVRLAIGEASRTGSGE